MLVGDCSSETRRANVLSKASSLGVTSAMSCNFVSRRLQGLDTDRDRGPFRSHVNPEHAEHGAKDGIFIRKANFVLSNLVSRMKCSVFVVGLTPPTK